MFFKLAVRNVKRQFTNYLIYFMTVAFTVALLFAVNNVLYSDALLLLLNGESDLRTILTWLVALVGLVVAFVLSYATSFMLKLRRREFGTYLTLGMQRGDILRIFLFETLLICGAALGAGLVLGLFLYQGLLALVMRMTEAAYAFSGYSLQGLRITVAVVAGIFVTALLVSSGYLRKVSIHDLLHGEKKVEKAVRHPVCWACVMLAAVTVVVGCLVSMSGQIEALIRESRGSAGSLITVMGMFALALMLFHVALTKSVVFLLLRCRQFRIRGSRTFVLRQLSGSLSSNALMHGSLAFLLTFAVIWVNLSFIIKGGQAEMLERSYPYDATYCEDRFFEGREQENAIPLAECERRIEKYRAILKKIPYQLYTTGRRELYEHTCWSKDVGYAGLVDFFMPAGDFNALIEPLGDEKVTLVDEYLIVSIDGRVGMTDFSSVTFAEAGKTYRFRGYTEEYPTFCRTYFFAVVPDEAVASMEKVLFSVAYDLEDGAYDGMALRKELTYPDVTGYGDRRETRQRSDFFLREYGRQLDNQTSAVIVAGALFVAAVFLLMALAILALKMLSDLTEDRRRYEVLFRLGADEREQGRALFGQTFFFFLLPFGSAMMMSIPTCMIGMRIVNALHIDRMAGSVPVITSVTAAAMLGLYLMYYGAAYLVARRAVIR